MAHLSRWLVQRRFSPQALTTEQIESFFRHRRRSGYGQFRTRRSLSPILSYLIETGAVRLIEEKPRRGRRTLVERTLEQYREYLIKERCLCEGTRTWYLIVARKFLAAQGDARRELSSLTAADLSAFVLRIFKKRSSGSCKYYVSALRSFLRYLFVHGQIPADLSTAVPAVAGWRLSGLPKGLSREEVQRLLASCDRRTRKGRRSYAVLVLMIRLGLRAREVAGLRLEDIHWRQGELVIHGKGGRKDVLPLPEDVGHALAAYLRHGRPRTESRAVFLMSRAPFRGFSSRVIQSVVTAACKRAGISPAGAHRLRHTAATEMVRRGVPLPEIAQVLRHRSIDTTAIYAKVDHASLRTLALPWPGGAA